MKKTFLTGIAVLSASAAFAQNSVTINQSGGGSGNQAVVSQSGSGNSIRINQRSTANRDSSGQPGNRVSLRVPKGTQTTINQDNTGPNLVELSQDGQASAIINQSSGTDENTVTTLPGQKPPTPGNRATKRRNQP